MKTAAVADYPGGNEESSKRRTEVTAVLESLVIALHSGQRIAEEGAALVSLLMISGRRLDQARQEVTTFVVG